MIRTFIVLLVSVVSLSLPAAAEVQANYTTDLTLDVFIPCAAGGMGEVVQLTGPLHIFITYTVNGNNVSGSIQSQPQGISGIGLTTGDKYQGNGVTRESFHHSLQNGQTNLTFVNNFYIIGRGQGSKSLLHETFHFTINADGTVTVTHDSLIVDCK